MPKLTFLAGLTAVTLSLSALSVPAATFTVTQTGNSGAGSLRTAITSANSSAGAHVIVFDLPGAGPHVIELTSPLPMIVAPVSILNDRGGDESVTLHRNSTQEFRIVAVQGFPVLLAGLTMSNGNVAGSISATGSTGGAIRNTGTLTVRNCTFSGNGARLGGAILNARDLAVKNCTFVNNTAVDGGAISNSGFTTLQVTNSTFSGNVASGNGGGVHGQTSGVITNATFSGNSAAAGGAAHSSVQVANTIFRRGSSGENLAGNFISRGNNLSDDAAGGDGTTAPGGVLDEPGDIRNTDPQLSALADNGGLTFTHALSSTSPAIDAGNDANAPPADQRNYTRAGVSDIGAFEVGGSPAPPPPMALTVTNINDSGPGSLRQAIANAAEGATIDFAANVTGAIILRSGELLIDKNLTINGPGASTLAIDGNSASRVLRISNIFSALTVNLSGVTIRGGRVVGPPNSSFASGGGISSGATLTIQDCVVSGNSVVGADATSSALSGTAQGGGIASGGPLTLINTLVSNNSAQGGNGSPSGSGTASGATATGGGIFHSGRLTITNSRIEGNAALGGNGADEAPNEGASGGSVKGGGIHQTGSEFLMTNSQIVGNTARAGQGGRGVESEDGGFGGSVEGAGLHLSGSGGEGLRLVECSVSDNLAIAGKGGDAASNGRPGGGRNAHGGGLFDGYTISNISRCTFSGNSATGGAAGQPSAGSTVAISEEGAGGAIFKASASFETPSLTLVNCTISGNSANGAGPNMSFANRGRGGGIAVEQGLLDATNCTFANNSATGDAFNGFNSFPSQGGNISVPQATLLLRNTIVAGGSAGDGPDVYGHASENSSFNLIGDGSDMTGVTDGNNGNKVGTSAAPLDPKLEPLTNNGGPTQTRALSAGSPAIDAGSDGSAPSTDQRNYTRAGVSDIGAFEFNGAPVPVAGVVGNVSTRLPVGAGDAALIEGFIIDGPAGSKKKIIVRALGPWLKQFGLTDALENPTLEIRGPGNVLLATNNNWETTEVGGIITGDQSAEIAASGFQPPENLEAAIIADLEPGHYTAVVRGVGNTEGTGLVDAYDLSANSLAKVVNFSTRGLVQAGDQLMIAGFVVQNAPVKAGIRGIGPSLSSFGVPNPLPDPTLELRDKDGMLVLANDNWETDAAQKAELESYQLQPGHHLEAALITTLMPGQYTAHLRDKNQASGIGVVEVYFLQ